MEQHSLKDVLEDAYADSKSVTKSLDDYLADAAMLHDWLVDRDQPPPSGQYDLYDHNAVELLHCPDELRDVVEGLIGVLADEVNGITGSHSDNNPSMNFEWDLANRRIVFTPDVDVDVDHDTDEVNVSEEELVDLNAELKLRGIVEAKLVFDGAGDSGQVEDPDYEYAEGTTEVEDTAFDERLKELVVESVDYDWYNNDGGHGVITFYTSPGDDTPAEYSFDAYYRTRESEADESSSVALTY